MRNLEEIISDLNNSKNKVQDVNGITRSIIENFCYTTGSELPDSFFEEVQEVEEIIQGVETDGEL